MFGNRVHFNGRHEGVPRLPSTCSVSIEGEAFHRLAVQEKLKRSQVGTGAACHSRAMKLAPTSTPPHHLLLMHSFHLLLPHTLPILSLSPSFPPSHSSHSLPLSLSPSLLPPSLTLLSFSPYCALSFILSSLYPSHPHTLSLPLSPCIPPCLPLSHTYVLYV